LKIENYKKIIKICIQKGYLFIKNLSHCLDTDPWPQGNEPLFRNGKLVGWTTTAAYGFTLGCHVR
jgi:hypothetical protein